MKVQGIGKLVRYQDPNDFLFVSKANQDEYFMIKTIGPVHSCGNQRDKKTINSGFLAKKYVEEF